MGDLDATDAHTLLRDSEIGRIEGICNRFTTHWIQYIKIG
jgi:hypothetical protein